MKALHAIGHALATAGSMTWQVLWALVLGFLLAAVVQAVVRREAVVRRLGDDRPRSLAAATGLGAASSSCSYAAVAMARALFRRGASFSASMAFEVASTNLVVELGIILALLIGWQFTLAEYVGGPVMIVVVALWFRITMRSRRLSEAHAQADKGRRGSMEGHAAMDMSIEAGGSLARRLRSPAALTAISHIFVMEWLAVVRDIAIGMLVAGALAAWVPNSFWQGFFFVGHPRLAAVWGPIVGPIVSMLSFVCSIGNVPLAAVLWNGGISFGGVISFILADLIIVPILVIYRKYYGARVMLVVLSGFYLATVVAGFVVEALFGWLGLVPATRHARVVDISVQWNYTTILNIVFLCMAAALIFRFARTGGMGMLRSMRDYSPNAPATSGHPRPATS